MNQKTLFIAIAALFILQCVNAGVIRNIDNFTPDVLALTATTTDYTSTDLVTISANGNDTIGTERDQVLFLDAGDPYFLVSSSIVDAGWVIGWEQVTTGYSLLQFDGYDNSEILNLNPGLSSYDATELGAAVAFILDISADHPAPYTIKVYGSTTSITSTYSFIARATAQSLAFDTYYIPFTLFSGNANFKNINGIELVMNNSLSLTGASQAIDTTVFTFATFGYSISGFAYFDCDSNGVFGSSETLFAGANVTLLNSGGTLLKTVNTDSNGDFSFVGLNNGTYQVCVRSTGATNTVPSSACRSVTLTNLIDVTGLQYGLRTQTTVVAPPNLSVTCGDCIDPECTGFATVSGCGGSGPVPTFSDSNSTSVCPKRITRTWSAAGTTSTSNQVITITDNVVPTLTNPAQNVNVNCINPSITMANWVSGRASATAVDCNGVTWTNNWNNVAPTNCNSRSVTFTATDPCGNFINTTATYTVSDSTSPNYSTQAQSSAAECNKNGNDITAFNTWLNSQGGAVVSDDCSPASAIVLDDNYTGGFTSGCSNSVTVTFSATDACGNKGFSTAVFTIQDTRAPTITKAAVSSSSECTGTGSNPAFTSWLNSHAGSTATDQCTATNSIVWTNDFDGSTPNSCNAGLTVTFFATDLCGRVASTSANFTVTDSTPPVLLTPASSLSFTCDTDNIQGLFENWLDNNGGADARDNCTTSVNWTNNADVNPASLCGVITVTFTASDLCTPARSVRTTASFTVTDTVAPVYQTRPQNVTTNCAGNTQSQFSDWLTTQGGATIIDNCSTQLTLSNNNRGTTAPSGCAGSARVIFSAADSCGNTASATATFSVTDNNPPSFDESPSDQIVECSSTSRNAYLAWLADNAGAEISDDCNTFTVTNNGPASINNGCNVVQTVTFTATDSCGNKDSETATFGIQDTIAPVITTEASDRSVTCDGTNQTSTLTNWLSTKGGAVATDSCARRVIWTNDFESLEGEGCILSTFVTFTASDGCGNFDVTSATFTISDTSVPTITRQAQPQTVQCDGYGNQDAFNNWLDSQGGAQATDVCVGTSSLSWSNNFGEGDLFTCGTTTVTFTVSDPCGDTASTSSSFTVFDDVAPSFNPSAQDLTVECDGYGNIFDYDNWVSSNGGAVAQDACATFLSVTNTAPATGPVGCGAVTVTFIATDDCNNSGRTTATYRVTDTSDPVIVLPASDASVECDGYTNQADISAWLSSQGGAVAVDQCNSVSWSNNFVGLITVDGCSAVATVTFTVVDRCSNQAQTGATFTVVDTTPPVVSVPAQDTVIQCSEFSNREINTWLATHGGAVATDSCSVVRWSNNYNPDNEDDSCATPIPVTFTATDLCGNFVETTATLTLTDSTAPIFVNFPEDIIVNCDQCSTAECIGIPIAADACTSNIDVTWTDDVTTGPTILLCPGNQNIVRTFFAQDACGNAVSKSQNIVVNIARSTGPCNPEDCPPCNTTLSCCTSTVPQVACNPVTCNSVACNPVSCIRVACTAVTAEDCSEGPTGNYIPPLPYGGGFGNNYECEPIYIYIFDDDDAVQNGEVNYEYVYVEVQKVSSAPRLAFASLFLVVLSIFALL